MFIEGWHDLDKFNILGKNEKFRFNYLFKFIVSDQTRRRHIGACKSTILINIRPSDREAIGNIYGSLMLI